MAQFARCINKLLFIALHNLLENACKYAAPDTPIALRLHATQDARGMPQMQLDIANQPGHAGWPDPEKLFDKYYRSPHGRRQAGTGLGLYLVRNLMHVMGGRIDYVPTADRVRLVLQLPMDAAPQSVA